MPFFTGSTFLHDTATGLAPHLWMIISDTEQNSERVVIVNFTTDDNIDHSCVLDEADHKFIKRTTYVNYFDAKIVDACQLNQIDEKALLTHMDDLSSDLLQRIRTGAASSRHLPIKIRKFLANQMILF